MNPARISLGRFLERTVSREAAKTYLNTDRYVQVTLYPEK